MMPVLWTGIRWHLADRYGLVQALRDVQQALEEKQQALDDQEQMECNFDAAKKVRQLGLVQWI